MYPFPTPHHAPWVHILLPAKSPGYSLKTLLPLQPSHGNGCFFSPQMISSLSATPFSFLLSQSLKSLSHVYSKLPCPSLSLLNSSGKKQPWLKTIFFLSFRSTLGAEDYGWRKTIDMLISSYFKFITHKSLMASQACRKPYISLDNCFSH